MHLSTTVMLRKFSNGTGQGSIHGLRIICDSKCGAKEAKMAEKFLCPACGKSGNSRQAVLAHFKKALEGFDPTWDSSIPHSRWAINRGLKVQDGGYFFDIEALKRVLYSHFDALVK
jgi:hypothetical protein